MTDQKEQVDSKVNTRKNILRRLIQVLMTVIVTAIILFVSAGRIKWIYAWLLILASFFVILANAFIFPRELISERGRKKENTEKWDKIITGIIIIPWIALYLISGLDIRFRWSPEMTLWVHITGR